MAIIEIDHVTKEFQLGQLQSLKATALNGLRRLVGKPAELRRPFKALDDVTISVEQGEVLGIIGQNGAGKSTLLKLLANISRPTSGRVAIRGKVAPLIEVGAGLVGDLTGRENIFLNASILGVPRREIARRFDDIVAFAELEEFIDTPIKRYSSGMQVRLGFSIATSVESDILIVDEVLAVGDLAFQRKCFDRMEDIIKRHGRTVLLVSHNIRQVERIATRVVLLDHGAVVSEGHPSDVCNLFVDRSNAKIRASQEKAAPAQLTVSDEVDSVSLDVLDGDGSPTDVVGFLDRTRIRLTFRARMPLREMTFYIGLHTTDFVYLTAHNTAYQPVDFDIGTHSVELEMKTMILVPGVYCLLAWIGPPTGRTVFYAENLATFRVFSPDYAVSRLGERALFHIDATWTLRPDKLPDNAGQIAPPPRSR